MKIEIGDFVQYRNAYGNLVGYGIIIAHHGGWHVLLDNATGRREHWCETLMTRIDP